MLYKVQIMNPLKEEYLKSVETDDDELFKEKVKESIKEMREFIKEYGGTRKIEIHLSLPILKVEETPKEKKPKVNIIRKK